MKKLIALLLALSLVLCGCGKTDEGKPSEKTTQPTTAPTTTTPAPPEPETPKEKNFGLYQPDSEVEIATGGALKEYKLEGWEYNNLMFLEEKLLLLSGENDTTLTCISPDGASVAVTLKDTFLMAGDLKYIADQGYLTYYDFNKNAMVFLDGALKVAKEIEMPEGSHGIPQITADGSLIYYMTEDALRYLEVETGIDRLLKEINFTYQSIDGLHFDDQIIECLVRDEVIHQCMMISTQTGELLYAAPQPPSLETVGDRYIATVWESEVAQYLFGTRDGQIQCLTPKDSIYTDLVDLWAAVSCKPTEDGFSLACYDLESGTCFSAVQAPVETLWCVQGDPLRGSIWFLSQNEDREYLIYQWVLDNSLTNDDTVYVSPYYTPENPDEEGLLRIGERAREIGRKYGIRVWVAQDALQMQPSDYTFEAQHLVSVYDQYLTILDEALGRYPDGFLKKLSSNCANGKLTISLIKGAYGDNGLGSLDSADGVHFFNDGSEYIGLVMGSVFESTLYHELFHSIDTYVMSRSNLYDFWNDLNPEGFSYDNDYVANQFREDYQYLEGDRWFIDMYSMSYAKEDRARIMEYAMGEDNSFYFQSPHMQAKLAKLSEGIRTAFGLKGNHGTFPWEQYLK